MTFDIGDGVDSAVNYILDNFAPLLDIIAAAIGTVTSGIQNGLLAAPMTLGLAIFVLLSLWRVGFKFAVFTGLSLWLVGHMGLWTAMMETLSLVLASTLIAMIIGLPLGVAMARSNRVATVVRPILDLMQTMPAFVYLIPAAMFFGLGAVPGTIATVIFSMPPVVRLTNLGIRQVHVEFIEAGNAFGCTAS
ncbi:ABC transporter permease, partial [Mycoplana dimorpha]